MAPFPNCEKLPGFAGSTRPELLKNQNASSEKTQSILIKPEKWNKMRQPKTTLWQKLLPWQKQKPLIWHGQKKGKFHLRCAKESFGYVWCFFTVVDVHMANMDALFFRGLLLYLFFCVFFVFVVVGCLGHDFLDGLRPPCILGRHSLDVPFQ